jgi:hypothetical protein
MKIKMILRGAVAFCVGTVLAELLLLSMFSLSGGLSRLDPYVLAAIFYGIDQATLEEYQDEMNPEQTFSVVGLEELSRKNMAQILNLDMRERSMQTAIDDLRFYETTLGNERQRYDFLRTDFEEQLARLEGVANNANLIRLRDAIANLDPAQAKDQIMAFLQNADDSGDQEIANDVVVMIKTMPIDKRKKIFSEFQTELEKRRLGYIVHEIRVGNPEVPLIRKVREKLRQFDSQASLDST